MLINLLIIILLAFVTVFTLFSGLYGAPTVPTPKAAVEKIVDLMGVKRGRIYYDLGSGDGRFLKEISKRDAVAIGFEYAPATYIYSKIRFLFTDRKKLKILWQNFYKTHFKNSAGIFCYLMPDTMARLEPKFQKELKKGSKLISYAFKMPNKKAEKVVKIKNCAPIYVYEY